jgi:hypothetical protein
VTIIISIVSEHGLISASDSNLTGASSSATGQKVFDLGWADGALAHAGAYRVGNERMDTWMPSCISAYAASTKSPTQEGFANYLAERLNTDVTRRQRQRGSLIQIVGYVSDSAGVHPALHFVRNFSTIDPSTGEYQGTGLFRTSEDFWSRDYAADKAGGLLRAGWYRSYVNGTPDGRVAFHNFQQLFGRFLGAVWSQPNWKFRPPQSLDELASIVELEIRTVGVLYGMSDYAKLSIGGDPQIHQITPPPGAIRLA